MFICTTNTSIAKQAEKITSTSALFNKSNVNGIIAYYFFTLINGTIIT